MKYTQSVWTHGKILRVKGLKWMTKKLALSSQAWHYATGACHAERSCCVMEPMADMQKVLAEPREPMVFTRNSDGGLAR